MTAGTERVDEIGPLVPWGQGGPEHMFQLGPVRGTAELATASMRTGPWVRDATGRPAAGALGVLLDDGLGGPIIATRPDAGLWGVTTEISADFGHPVPDDGSEVTSEARALHADRSTGLAAGVLRDAEGRVLAVATHRQRFVSGQQPDAVTSAHPCRADEALPLPDLLGLLFEDEGGNIVARMPARPELANPSGNLHGGITLCAAELASAAAAEPHTFYTASIRVVYGRPIPLDGETRFVAEVHHRTRSLAVVQIEALRPDGKVGARATVVRELAASRSG